MGRGRGRRRGHAPRRGRLVRHAPLRWGREDLDRDRPGRLRRASARVPLLLDRARRRPVPVALGGGAPRRTPGRARPLATSRGARRAPDRE